MIDKTRQRSNGLGSFQRSTCAFGGSFPVSHLPISGRHCSIASALYHLSWNAGAWTFTYSSHSLPCTEASSDSVMRCPVVKYPGTRVLCQMCAYLLVGNVSFCPTSCDLCVNLNTGVCRDPGLGKLDSFVNGDSSKCVCLSACHVCSTTSICNIRTYPCPTMASCFMLFDVGCTVRLERPQGIWGTGYMGNIDALAHAEHPVDFSDAQPVQNIRHESLETHILDSGYVFGPLEVVRSPILTTLARIVHKILCDFTQSSPCAIC